MQQARDRLADAEAILGTVHPAVVVSAAYYGMLYAGLRCPGEFDQRLSALARRAKDAREEGDYEAAPASPEEASEFVKGTAEFIAAIEQLLNKN